MIGYNKELAYDVGQQLEYYIRYIESNIENWIYSYQETYQQMKKLKLFDNQPWEEIKIEAEVKGIIVVGGYSGIAKESIRKLKKHYPELVIKLMENKL